jgi:hypothetical protein
VKSSAALGWRWSPDRTAGSAATANPQGITMNRSRFFIGHNHFELQDGYAISVADILPAASRGFAMTLVVSIFISSGEPMLTGDRKGVIWKRALIVWVA